MFQKYLTPLLWGTAIIVHIITWVVLWHYSPLTGSSTPLHYNVVTGFDDVGSRGMIYFLPLFGLAIFVINAIVAVVLRRLGSFIPAVCAAASTVVGIILLLAATLLRIQAG